MNTIKFCLDCYNWKQDDKDTMIKTLAELGFKIDDYGSIIFAEYKGEKLNAIVNHESFTGKLYIAIFDDPNETLLKIPQERISAIYCL